MSPIILRSPATCAYTNGNNISTRSRKDKTLSRRPASAIFLPPLSVSKKLMMCYR